MHYYQHHIGDFDRATRHLTRIERSIYLDLLFCYYDTETVLTKDMAALCRKVCARSEDEKSAVLAILDEYFLDTPAGWFHERCEEVIAEYRKKGLQASEAGKASAAARAERRAAAMGKSPTGAERLFNENPTTVERPLNDRSTDVQRTGNEPSTEGQPTNNHKPETKNQKVKTTVPPDGETSVSPAQVVFAYWQKARNHGGAKLDDKRARAIRARLKDGYTVEDLCQAIDGIAHSQHHMGMNEQRTVYDDIELICRNGPNVDKFRKLAGAMPGVSPQLQHQIDVLNEWMEESQ